MATYHIANLPDLVAAQTRCNAGDVDDDYILDADINAVLSKPSLNDTWSSLVTYAIGDYCKYNFMGSWSVYIAIQAGINQTPNPAGTAYWSLMFGPAGSSPMGSAAYPFSGTFDGNGKNITSLYTASAGFDYQGFFGYIQNASAAAVVVKDLTLTNYSLTGGDDYIGAIAGYFHTGSIDNCSVVNANVAGDNIVGSAFGIAATDTTITDCSVVAGDIDGDATTGGFMGQSQGAVSGCWSSATVTATVADPSTEYGYGGFVGQLLAGTITDCYATGSVTSNSDHNGGFMALMSGGSVTRCYATGNVSGRNRCGGFCSVSSGAAATDCYATGSVTTSQAPDSQCGGFVARINTTGAFTRCHATGALSYGAGTTHGGFAGYLNAVSGNDVGTDNYYCSTTTGEINTGVGFTPLTSAEYLIEQSFNGWDFGSTWQMNLEMPVFRYEQRNIQYDAGNIQYSPPVNIQYAAQNNQYDSAAVASEVNEQYE